MDHLNKNVAFGYPIVLQKRNKHNLWNDLEKELIGNINCEKIIEKLNQIHFKSNNVLDCGYELVDYMMKNVDFEIKHFQKILKGLKIWLDTIKESRYEDTNKIFEKPSQYDFRVAHKDAVMWAFLIKQDILDKHGSLGPHSK